MQAPPLLPDARLHDWNSCKAPQQLTHGWPHASVTCAATPRAWSIHLVLLHVRLHVLLPCTVTPRASIDTQLAGQLTPRSEHSHQAISCFSVHSSDFDPSDHEKTGFKTPHLSLDLDLKTRDKGETRSGHHHHHTTPARGRERESDGEERERKTRVSGLRKFCRGLRFGL
ncbi:hypothetical protein F2Q69_00063071 [Brassica cretica]|uniref:Uncharacterized protein n=1 Tax=Brassica cretica TaxID=69181 RepID=A0A8S9RJB7_BRACR|nr:hypothetical protein F2Q69_00063071 [Brassica cretica]